MPGKTVRSQSFRIGKVKAYLRGRVWYLCYFENGQRRRPRVGPDRDAAKQLAAQTNAQLEIGAPALLSFEPLAIDDLRVHWLQHHEQNLSPGSCIVMFVTHHDVIPVTLLQSPFSPSSCRNRPRIP